MQTLPDRAPLRPNLKFAASAVFLHPPCAAAFHSEKVRTLAGITPAGGR